MTPLVQTVKPHMSVFVCSYIQFLVTAIWAFFHTQLVVETVLNYFRPRAPVRNRNLIAAATLRAEFFFWYLLRGDDRLFAVFIRALSAALSFLGSPPLV